MTRVFAVLIALAIALSPLTVQAGPNTFGPSELPPVDGPGL